MCLICEITVSYTHLDVYKRQGSDSRRTLVLKNLEKITPFIVDAVEKGAVLLAVGLGFQVLGRYIKAVSYTHLDVYKRQCVGCPGGTESYQPAAYPYIFSLFMAAP